MTDKNLYTLKQPVEIKRFPTQEGSIGRNKGYEEVVTVRRPDGKRLTDLYPDEFEELFEPLDVESLTTQLDNIIQGYGARQYQRGFKVGAGGESGDTPIPRDKELDAGVVAEVLELICMKGEE